MAENEDDWIRRRAYSLWEEEGRPSGRDAEHWERATQELQAFNEKKPKRATSRTRAAMTADDASMVRTTTAPKRTVAKGTKKKPTKLS